MNYYRHIVKNLSYNEIFEVDNTYPTLREDEIAGLPLRSYDTLEITDIDITEQVLKQQEAEKEKLKEEAFTAAWNFITPYFDQPSFIQMTDWKREFPETHPVNLYIKAVEGWKNSIMFEYLMVKKPSIFMDMPYDLDYSFVGSPPCKFTDLFLMANPSLQAYIPDWTPPDISSYQPGTRQDPKPVLF